MQVALQVVEQRKKLKDTKKIWNLGGCKAWLPVSLAATKTLAMTIKNYGKADSVLSGPVYFCFFHFAPNILFGIVDMIKIKIRKLWQQIQMSIFSQ